MNPRKLWLTYDGCMRSLPKGARVRHVPLKLDGVVNGLHRNGILEELGVTFDDGQSRIVKSKSLVRYSLPPRTTSASNDPESPDRSTPT